MQDKTFSQINARRELVAEQRGLPKLLLGIGLSLIFGLLVKTIIAPEKIRNLILKHSLALPSDVQLQFESASIRLADGILPDFSLVITNLSLSAPRTCWLSPMLEVDELRFPVSWTHLFGGEIYIHRALADQVSLSIRSNYKDCEAVPLNTESQLRGNDDPSELSPVNAVTDSKVKRQLARMLIDSISIRSLKVHYLPIAFTYFELRDLTLSSTDPSYESVQASGVLRLGGETLTGDYFSQANIQLDYQKNKGTNLRAEGNWREGSYSVDASYQVANKQYSWALEQKHIPVSQLLPLLKKYKLVQSDLNPKQLWISGNFSSAGAVESFEKNPVLVDRLKFEGDIGELEANSFQILSLTPFRFDTMTWNIRSLNLARLLELLGKGHPSPILGQLGVLQGKAWIENSTDFTLDATHSGLEFIFSNRGSRQVQSISLLGGSIEFRKGQWKIDLDRVKPSEGSFLGRLKLRADRDWTKVQIETQIEDLTLGPVVQKLMTSGGELGAVSGEALVVFEKGKVSDLRGNLNFRDLQVEGIRARLSRVQVSTRHEETLIDLVAPQLSIGNNSTSFKIFAPLLGTALSGSEAVELSKVNLRLKTQQFNELSWQSLSARMDRSLLRSQGGWNARGELTGRITLGKQAWLLSGSRDKPLLNLVSYAK